MLKIRPLPGKRRELLTILASMQEQLLIRHDCIVSEIYEPFGGEDEVFYLEQWRTKESLYRHIESDLYRRVLMAMELASESPQISFPELTNVKGMELIVALREGGDV